MSLLSHLWPTDDAHAVVVASTVVVTTLVYSLLRAALWPPTPSVIRGPLHTVLPTLSERELEVLEYKTDAFPGARDVDTPVSWRDTRHAKVPAPLTPPPPPSMA